MLFVLCRLFTWNFLAALHKLFFRRRCVRRRVPCHILVCFHRVLGQLPTPRRGTRLFVVCRCLLSMPSFVRMLRSSPLSRLRRLATIAA